MTNKNTNTRTQSNLRLLKSRNQREGWYAGKGFCWCRDWRKKYHLRSHELDLRLRRKDQP